MIFSDRGSRPGLVQLWRKAGAEPVGIGTVVEKGFQNGSEVIKDLGIDHISLAVVESLTDGEIRLRRL